MTFNAIIAAVDSTAIKAFKYNHKKLWLDIQFTSGKLYRYKNIKPLEFTLLATADSTGKAYNTYIKGAGKKATKLRRKVL